jgi:hypothetical protein
MRLTLRTLLAYLDDTLPPHEAMTIGRKVAESEKSRELVDKIKKLTRKRGLATPMGGGNDSPSNPNTVAEYLSDALPADAVAEMEAMCLESDVNLAEVAACHQILTLLLSEPARVPPTARKRMYELVTGPESLPNRKPGLTVPIGGMPTEQARPERDDRDAGLLIGLSPAGKGLRWFLAIGLAALALFIAWLAWPRIEMRNGTPIPYRTEQPKLNEPLPVDREVLPIPSPTEVQVPNEPVPEPKKVDVVPKPVESTSIDPARRRMGSVVSKDHIVLSSMGSGPFARVVENGPVFSADRLLCLPGYKGKLALDPNLTLEMWANLPEQFPQGPLETAITIHAPSSSVVADLTIHAGRIYLQTSDPKGATIRVRCVDQIWDFKLPDANSEIVIERMFSRIRGLSLPADRQSHSMLACSAFRGAVDCRTLKSAIPFLIRPGEACTLSADTGVAGLANEFSQFLSRQSIYPDAVRAASAQKSLAIFAADLSPMDRINVKLTEAIDGESLSLARIAVFGQCAVGAWTDVASALLDPNRPHVRDAAIVALRAALSSQPSIAAMLEKTMVEKSGFSSEQARDVLSLLRGPKSDEVRSPRVLAQLVDGLTANVLPIRELSHRILMTDIDPEAVRNPLLVRYDPMGPIEARDAAQQLWRKRVEELLKMSRVNSPDRTDGAGMP